MDLGLTGARVIVIGAGGLGSACARGFVDAGATVAAIDRDAAALAALASDAPASRVHEVVGDLTDEQSCYEALESAHERLGSVDVLVHSLGVNLRKPLLDFSTEEWRRIMLLNLDTAFWAAKFAGNAMRGRGGRVVMFSSVAGTLGHKHHGPYAATKGGINQLTKVLAHEWASEGIMVNAIAPGYVETGLTRDHLDSPGVRSHLTALVPAGRLGVPAEVVGPVLFLSSPLASFVTGQILHVDGGRTLI